MGFSGILDVRDFVEVRGFTLYENSIKLKFEVFIMVIFLRDPGGISDHFNNRMWTNAGSSSNLLV